MMRTLISILVSTLLLSCGGSVKNLSVGDEAPLFSLNDSKGNAYLLSNYIGKSPIVIYFYPKANTSGCTKQACGVRDDYSTFKQSGIEIFGISTDGSKDINEFEIDYNLNFPLLSDENKEVSKLYDVLNNLGFANRVTFIIDKRGNLANIIKDVNVDTHSNDVYELAKKLL